MKRKERENHKSIRLEKYEFNAKNNKLYTRGCQQDNQPGKENEKIGKREVQINTIKQMKRKIKQIAAVRPEANMIYIKDFKKTKKL